MKNLLLACLIVPFMFVAANAQSIGEVRKVQNWATIQNWAFDYAPKKEPLFARDKVFQHSGIETPSNGAVWIIFNDDTELFIAELSEYYDELKKISNGIPSKAALSRTGFFNIGNVMKQFYLFLI